MQRNWIGKSEGLQLEFKIKDSAELSFEVYTTRPDTLFGASYCVLAPEHELVEKICSEEQQEAVDKYVRDAINKSDRKRQEAANEKTGVFSGAYAINPANNKAVPIYIADYVLITAGTGAIMAVPAHDQRDYEFATKFNLEIIEVLEGGDISKEAYTADGPHINSDFIDGLNIKDAKRKCLSGRKIANLAKELPTISYAIGYLAANATGESLFQLFIPTAVQS